MRTITYRIGRIALAAGAALALTLSIGAQSRSQKPTQDDRERSSYTPVNEEPFEEVRKRDIAEKPRIMAAHMKLLESRYDLSRRVAPDATMTRGKPIPVGPTARLKGGLTWEQLGK